MNTIQPGNLFANLSATKPAMSDGELFEQLATNAATGVRIERIVSWGHASDEGFWYDQNQPEWVVVLQGSAVLALEGQADVHLMPGDFLNIPAHVKHRVVSTAADQPTVWLAVFY